VKVATFEKDDHPDSRAIVNGISPDIKDQSFGHGLNQWLIPGIGNFSSVSVKF